MNITEDEFIEWKKFIRGTAANICRQWAYLQWESLLDDCEGAAWEAVVKFGLHCPRIKWEIQNSIQDEIARALYGRKRKGRGITVNLLSIIQADDSNLLFNLPSQSSERQAMNKDLIKKLYDSIVFNQKLTSQYKIRILSVWKGLYENYCEKRRGRNILIPKRHAQVLHITQNDIHRGKKFLKENLKKLMGTGSLE